MVTTRRFPLEGFSMPKHAPFYIERQDQLTQIYILVQVGTSMSTFPFHFQSVSGPQPNVVVASDLNE